MAFGDAAALYAKNCASCHGKDGSGATKMGKKAGARDYRDAKVQSSFSDAEGIKAIKEGVKDGKEKMKAYDRQGFRCRSQGTCGIHPRLQEITFPKIRHRASATGTVVDSGVSVTRLRFFESAIRQFQPRYP